MERVDPNSNAHTADHAHAARSAIEDFRGVANSAARGFAGRKLVHLEMADHSHNPALIARVLDGWDTLLDQLDGRSHAACTAAIASLRSWAISRLPGSPAASIGSHGIVRIPLGYDPSGGVHRFLCGMRKHHEIDWPFDRTGIVRFDDGIILPLVVEVPGREEQTERETAPEAVAAYREAISSVAVGGGGAKPGFGDPLRSPGLGDASASVGLSPDDDRLQSPGPCLVRDDAGDPVVRKCIFGSENPVLDTLRRLRRYVPQHDGLSRPTEIVHLRNEVVHVFRPYVEGLTLLELVERDGPIAPASGMSDAGKIRAAATLRAIFDPVVEALDAMHEAGFVHRDVTPANLVVRVDSGRGTLIDVENLAEVEGFRPAQSGTRGFSAPEQVLHGIEDHRADVYGLAATIAYSLTGQVDFLDAPWRGERIRMPSDAGLYANQVAALEAALSPLPSERPASAGALWRSIR